MKAATDEHHIIPGEVSKTQPSHIAPASDSTNLRHKFMYALQRAHPGLTRDIKDKICDHPSLLGNNTYIAAI